MKYDTTMIAGIIVLIGMIADIICGVWTGNAAIQLAVFLIGAFLITISNLSVTSTISDSHILRGQSP